MANDPASITREALERLLDMSVQGKGVVLGPDPVTGKCVVNHTHTYAATSSTQPHNAHAHSHNRPRAPFHKKHPHLHTF